MKAEEIDVLKNILVYMIECNDGKLYNHPKKDLMGELNDIIYAESSEDFLKDIREREWDLDQEWERNDKVSNTILHLPIGMMFDKITNFSDFSDFCDEIGLNSWCLNEGLATRETLHPIKISVAKKYGII